MARLIHATELNIVTTFLGLFMVLFMLSSSFIQGRIYFGSAPIAFTTGTIFGSKSAKLMNPLAWADPSTVTLEVSRIVLAIQCFGNAVELPKTYVQYHWQSITWIIGPVMAGGKADSNDPGKVSKPNEPAEFKVPEKEFSMDEVKKHNKKDDLWIVVKGVVLDVTHWLDEHPGGPQALFSHMGKDATEGESLIPNITRYHLTRSCRVRDVAR